MWLKRITHITLPALVFGFLLTLVTLFYQTTTTMTQAVGDRCNGIWCDDPLPQAGFPFPYLRDSLGTSVIGSLGAEDTFLPGAFFMDWVPASFIIWLLLYSLAKKKAS